MQPRTAHRTAPDEPVPQPHGAAGLDDELAAVIAGARRRAVRDGDRQTDTAHLLHSLLEHDPEVRAAVGGPPQLARLLGYLVQRSIGYGLRWQGSVEDSGEVEDSGNIVAAPARTGHDAPAGGGGGPSAEDAAAAGRDAPAGPGEGGSSAVIPASADHDPTPRDAAGWSPAAAAALAEACGRARRRGAPRVTGADLLKALVGDPSSRAVEVLKRAGISAPELVARIETGAAEAGDGEGAAAR
ncbi:Clp protease N-terminal domain-containing protein [Streptomyces sp. NPDC006193]|uniref:Clp protease N-terminal domain-containing protein n=1 Tax=Streptomyces sp. NPDC006193 TaxID=3155717 RepID=UPI0033B8C633